MVEKVRIEAELDVDQAWAFAEFLKRVLPEDFEKRAADRQEAGLMWDAGLCIQQALAEKGFSPR